MVVLTNETNAFSAEFGRVQAQLNKLLALVQLYRALGGGWQRQRVVEPLIVGFHTVARGRIKADDTVVILGCGGVGLGAVAASNARGARTICVDMDDEKLVVARAAGGSDAINTANESLHDLLQELTEGRGPDVVIEAIGTPQTFRAAIEEVAHGKSGVHRLCQRTGKLRDKTLRAKRAGHSRFAKRAAGRFSCGNPSSRGEEVPCGPGCEFGGTARRDGGCPAIVERESDKLQEDHGLRGLTAAEL
jgi:hypothetical protein